MDEIISGESIAKDMKIYGISIRDDEEGIIQLYQLNSKNTPESDIAEIRYNPETGIILPLSSEEVRKKRDIPEIYRKIIKPMQTLIKEVKGDLHDTVFDPIMEASDRVSRSYTDGYNKVSNIPDTGLSEIVEDAMESLKKLKY